MSTTAQGVTITKTGEQGAFGGELLTVNFGPHHPSTHGVLRLIVDLDGEQVKSVKPVIGYLHTGIEKQAEALRWQQVVVLTDRHDYLSPPINNLAYALAVDAHVLLPRARHGHGHERGDLRLPDAHVIHPTWRGDGRRNAALPRDA